MRIENVKLPRESGVPPIALTMWIPEGEPKGVVQILHGMAEHISRYDRPARALAGAGYLVAGHDHRGHGPDWPKDRLGWFSEKDGWKKILEDAHKVTGYLSGRFPGTPLILLGHSMGSFLAREYALVWPGELSALILSGTGSYGRPLAMAGSVLAGLTPPGKPAALVDRIAFSGNNKAFAPARTPFDWLSRDEKEVDKYVSDPLCGFTFTGRAFRDFFGGLTRLTDQKRLKVMDPDMPVLFISIVIVFLLYKIIKITNLINEDSDPVPDNDNYDDPRYRDPETDNDFNNTDDDDEIFYLLQKKDKIKFKSFSSPQLKNPKKIKLIEKLQISLEVEYDKFVHLKIRDPKEKRWEVPESRTNAFGICVTLPFLS